MRMSAGAGGKGEQVTHQGFAVYGKPIPQGSMRGFVRGGKAVITSDNTKLKPWRRQVALTAIAEKIKCAEKHAPVGMQIDFFFLKPDSAKKRNHPAVKPDLDKLIRAILDALKGIAFQDDGQVCGIRAQKHYDAIERTEVRLWAHE